MRPTRNPGYITIRVRMDRNKIVIWSGGTTFEIPLLENSIYVMPRFIKEAEGQWDKTTGKYIVLSRIITLQRKVIVNPVLLDDSIAPTNYNLMVRYSGKAVKRFIELLFKVFARYYKGQNVLRLPMSDRNVFRLALALARMSELQSISDVL